LLVVDRQLENAALGELLMTPRLDGDQVLARA
jgi:hypothetical protein